MKVRMQSAFRSYTFSVRECDFFAVVDVTIYKHSTNFNSSENSLLGEYEEVTEGQPSSLEDAVKAFAEKMKNGELEDVTPSPYAF